ncbi:type II toxin-antitoxin system RelE/ParE family toxin [Sphingomonas sp. GB1N7]|uniref:type II toxin-antitoxin system RelE/ParE family toxin n=1 Tax=Parasphingomonas caseinilytica TaxID=3096158 RepID=UPI002FCC72DD
MRLIWDDRARRDLREVLDYISDRNIVAAERLEETISHTLEFLTIHPFMYRAGRISRTREAVVHPNYVVVYSVDDDLITIRRVLHARQNYP